MPRSGFHAQLTSFDDEVRALFAVVAVGVARATDAFLAGDPSEATRVADGADVNSTVLSRVEHEITLTFARQAPMATDLRFMLTVLRIVPQLERCVELAQHIAERAAFAADLPPDLLDQFAMMGTTAARMWEAAATAWEEVDPDAASRLDEADDELDVLADELARALSSGSVPWTAAMECRLVVRFYERLGDHAVHVAERIRYWATGA
jgi:phosphate transport system protein